MTGEWSLALRFAVRELRGGLSGFRIFLACLTLGVAAIATVGSVSSALLKGLNEEGQTLLSGDMEFRLTHRRATGEERGWLEAQGDVSEISQLRAMALAPKTGESTLIELKGVDDAYPLFGVVKLKQDRTLTDALAKQVNDVGGKSWGAVVEPVLLMRLGIGVGDTLKLGKNFFEVRGVIANEPDRVATGIAYGSRVMVDDEALSETGLVRLGSLVNWHYRVRLPEGQASDGDIKAISVAATEQFPLTGWRIRDRHDGAPGVRRFIEQLTLFLTLVGLTALVVGGVGVGNAVTSYLDHKREVIATFKCLGAPGGLIFRIYLAQVMMLALVGVIVGLGIGAVLPFIIGELFGDLLPVPTRFRVYPSPLFLAAAYGVLAALAFAVWPLARARDIPAASLFREIVAPERRWPRLGYILIAGGALVGLAVLAIALTENRMFASWFVLGTAASFIVLYGTGQGLIALVRRAPRPRTPTLRLGLANLHRPGARTAGVVLSLGLGLTLLVTVSLIDGNIRNQVARELPDLAPSFFFMDVQSEQVPEFDALIAAQPGVVEFNRVPMLRGRITAVKDIPVEDLSVTGEAAWVLRGDRGVTYAVEPPKGSVVISGEWWAPDYAGPPLVSITDDVARSLDVGVGDTLRVNVLGREITPTIASLRKVEWQSMGINFVLVFAPGLLESAPHSHLATLAMEVSGERDLQREVTRVFPNITVIRVKEALETVNSLLSDLVIAVRATSAITLLAGVLVLAGAMAAGHRARLYDSVILKVLGATRRRVLSAYLWEYALLGAVTAIVASLSGAIIAFLVVTQVMESEWIFLPGTLAVTVVVSVVLTILLGLMGTWRALTAKAAPVLRTQ